MVKSRYSKRTNAKTGMLAHVEKAETFLVSRPDWNGGKLYEVKLQPSIALRLSYQGYKVYDAYMKPVKHDAS